MSGIQVRVKTAKACFFLSISKVAHSGPLSHLSGVSLRFQWPFLESGKSYEQQLMPKHEHVTTLHEEHAANLKQ